MTRKHSEFGQYKLNNKLKLTSGLSSALDSKTRR